MTQPSSTIIIIIVIAFAFYLIYSQNSQPKYVSMPNQQQQQISPFIPQIQNPNPTPHHSCQKCDYYKNALLAATAQHQPQPHVTNVSLDHDSDPYSDPIKKQDLYSVLDPLTYPQLRLPRDVLDKYNEHYEKNGSYPPFNQATQPLFDNPILNGVLIKQVDENEPFTDNVPSSVPLFRVKSAKNNNRFFYYIIDQRYPSKIELKIPLDYVKINGVRYNNADFYGLPELYDGDIVENIPIYPSNKFRITLYKIYHFP